MSKVSEQQLASDPSLSIWLSASAGTGKTKVLTDRVLRLLLSGVQPRKILCLTFTNAAASEMKERIYSKISSWSAMNNKDLKIELELLTGGAFEAEMIHRAKGLLSDYLQRSDGLNIYTIHSFCQKLLKQFPLEAGISPNFRIIDEINQQQILLLMKQELINDERSESLVAYLLKQMHDTKLTELIDEVLNRSIEFKNLFERFVTCDDYKKHLYHVLKIKDINELSILLEAKKSLLQHLAIIHVEDFKDAIARYIDSDEELLKKEFDKLKSLFLTKDDQKKKKLLNKSIQNDHPDQAKLLLEIQDIIYQVQDQIKSLLLWDASIKLYELAKVVTEKYQSYKTRRGVLDYDDLIYYTHNLFTESEYKDWILYKLDGGIEHILVDEAQDTSSHQWGLILALLSDFVAGESDRKESKSIFVVGDEKQSIYSFQGAEYEQFNEIKSQVLQALKSSQKNHAVVNLGVSYRSSNLILDAVDKVFRSIRQVDNLLFAADNFSLQCYLEHFGGGIELWQLHKPPQDVEVFWPVLKNGLQENASVKLAKDLAVYIKNFLDSKKVLFSTQKPVEPSDFMILLRQRSDFAMALIRELKILQIPVSGLDRISLFEDLAVMDLLSAARFALLPEDELNLACLLKSPLIGLSDADLYDACYAREQNLYSKICCVPKYRESYDFLEQIRLLANKVSISDFFYILVYGKGLLTKLMGAYESIDTLNELINIALKFEREISCSLQEFIFWCDGASIEISRDNSNDGVVKIMTVHGAKGLQSPIVILPDTTGLPRLTNKFLYYDECPIFAFNAGQHNCFYESLKDEEGQKQYKEYLRLLYVAVTRSREHLVICGHANSATIDSRCWYSILENALSPDLEQGKHEDVVMMKIESVQPRPSIISKINQPQSLPLINLIPFNTLLARENEVLEANSPLVEEPTAGYGQIIHKVMEDAVAFNDLSLLLTHPLLELLPEYYMQAIGPNLRAICNNDEFRQLISQQIKVEVSIASIDRYRRIDLFSMFDDKIIIVDYKTDKAVPHDISQVPSKYINQLLDYKEMIQNIYPDKQVQAKILWVMAAKFMQIC